MSCCIHNVPGRLRIKIPAIKHQHQEARRLERMFENVSGIDLVAANALTGSLKIHYDVDVVDSEQLLLVLKTKNVIDETAIFQDPDQSYSGAVRLSQACGKAMINWAVGKTLESNGLGLLSAFI
jgi:hypothetical protein